MDLTYSQKCEELQNLKRYLQRCKQILVSKRIGQGEYIDNSVIIKLTSMIVTSIELIEVYRECQINELDSVMDVLVNTTPEFYHSANKILEINKMEEQVKSPIQGLNKQASKAGISEGMNFKKKVLSQKLETILISYDEPDQYFGNNKKPL